MKFSVKPDEPRTEISLQQAVDDVVVRVDNLGAVVFQASNASLRVSRQVLNDAGLTLIIEEPPAKG